MRFRLRKLFFLVALVACVATWIRPIYEEVRRLRADSQVPAISKHNLKMFTGAINSYYEILPAPGDHLRDPWAGSSGTAGS